MGMAAQPRVDNNDSIIPTGMSRMLTAWFRGWRGRVETPAPLPPAPAKVAWSATVEAIQARVARWFAQEPPAQVALAQTSVPPLAAAGPRFVDPTLPNPTPLAWLTAALEVLESWSEPLPVPRHAPALAWRYLVFLRVACDALEAAYAQVWRQGWTTVCPLTDTPDRYAAPRPLRPARGDIPPSSAGLGALLIGLRLPEAGQQCVYEAMAAGVDWVHPAAFWRAVGFMPVAPQATAPSPGHTTRSESAKPASQPEPAPPPAAVPAQKPAVRTGMTPSVETATRSRIGITPVANPGMPPNAATPQNCTATAPSVETTTKSTTATPPAVHTGMPPNAISISVSTLTAPATNPGMPPSATTLLEPDTPTTPTAGTGATPVPETADPLAASVRATLARWVAHPSFNRQSGAGWRVDDLYVAAKPFAETLQAQAWVAAQPELGNRKVLYRQLAERGLILPHGGQRVWALFVTEQGRPVARYVSALKLAPALYAGLELGPVFQGTLEPARAGHSGRGGE